MAKDFATTFLGYTKERQTGNHCPKTALNLYIQQSSNAAANDTGLKRSPARLFATNRL